MQRGDSRHQPCAIPASSAQAHLLARAPGARHPAFPGRPPLSVLAAHWSRCCRLRLSSSPRREPRGFCALAVLQHAQARPRAFRPPSAQARHAHGCNTVTLLNENGYRPQPRHSPHPSQRRHARASTPARTTTPCSAHARAACPPARLDSSGWSRHAAPFTAGRSGGPHARGRVDPLGRALLLPRGVVKSVPRAVPRAHRARARHHRQRCRAAAPQYTAVRKGF